MNDAFVTRDDFRHRRDIEPEYLQGIVQATSEIVLCQAYFLPGAEFRQALISAAERGVRVVLLVQGRTEFFLQYYAARALYGNFLDAGIEIYEYRKEFLPTKMAVIDGHWARVGSSNIDRLSLILARQANLIVKDKVFAATLAQGLKKTIETDGQRILRDNWEKESFGLRSISWLSYLVVSLMMGIRGYAPEKERIREERPRAPAKRPVGTALKNRAPEIW